MRVVSPAEIIRARAVRQAGPLPGDVSVRTTAWGYVVQGNGAAARRAPLVEIVASGMGLLLVMLAAGQWFFTDAGVLPAFKFGASVAFALLGGVLIWYAQRGRLPEVQVDLARRALRFGTRNRHGRFHLAQIVPFAHVGSVFIYRMRAGMGPSRLYLRHRDTQNVTEIAQGSAPAMEALLARIGGDITG